TSETDGGVFVPLDCLVGGAVIRVGAPRHPAYGCALAWRVLSAGGPAAVARRDGLRRVALLFGHRLAAASADRASRRRNSNPLRRDSRAARRVATRSARRRAPRPGAEAPRHVVARAPRTRRKAGRKRSAS